MISLLTPLDVFQVGAQGFAASILAVFFVLGVLVLVMIFVSSKPRRRRGRPDPPLRRRRPR